MVYRRDWGQPQPGGMGFMRTAKAYGRKVNLAAIDVQAGGGPIGMFKLPPFFLVLGAYGNCAKLDTGTVALTFNIGDPASANRFAAASTIGQAGGAITTLAATGLAFPTYQETEVLFQVATAANVAAAGILEYYLWGVNFA
jgi:hypothetical protein